MIRKATLALLGLIAGIAAMAQASAYTPGRVAFTPVFDSSFSGYSQEISEMMQNKLTQIAMQNGVGSFSEQYVLTAQLVLDDKQVTQTTPAQYVVKLSCQLQAVDTDNKVLVGALTLPLTGVDRTEHRAYLAAIRQLNPRNPKVVSFVRAASDAIVRTYNELFDSYMASARELCERGSYDDALSQLAQIPSQTERYDEVRELSSDIYARSAKQQAAATAKAEARRQAENEAAEEAAQRERDREAQLQMQLALQKKAEAADRAKMVNKVKDWFLGSLKQA